MMGTASFSGVDSIVLVISEFMLLRIRAAAVYTGAITFDAGLTGGYR